MNSKQAGFTLIELVMVIVILGILAAVAVPKFVDLSAQADDAAVKGVAGALASAAATNYAAKAASGTSVTVAACNDVASALAGGLPTGYTISTTAISTTAGVTASCTVTGGNTKTATFVGISA